MGAIGFAVIYRHLSRRGLNAVVDLKGQPTCFRRHHDRCLRVTATESCGLSPCCAFFSRPARAAGPSISADGAGRRAGRAQAQLRVDTD